MLSEVVIISGIEKLCQLHRKWLPRVSQNLLLMRGSKLGIVISKLIDGQKALQQRIDVAEVVLSLEPDHSVLIKHMDESVFALELSQFEPVIDCGEFVNVPLRPIAGHFVGPEPL